VPSLTRSAPDEASRPVAGHREGCLDSTGHRLRVVGSVQPGRGSRLDCDHPLRAVCRNGCGHVEFWRCDSYGCEPCGELKQRRLSRLVDGGASIHLGAGLVGYFLTLTAPGSRSHRRWVQGRQHGPRPDCDCHEHGLTDGLWNAQESACWNRMRTALTRDRSVTFAGAVETQKRGMLHRHVLLFTDRPLTFLEVQRLALAAGYGCVVDVESVRSAEKAARYISKYVTKASRDRAVVPWERLDHGTGEVIGKRPTYRLWSSSRRWGVTMRQIKATQAAQARQRAMYLRDLAELLAADSAPGLAVAEGSAPATGPPDPPG
jgi:hypothetical protein